MGRTKVIRMDPYELRICNDSCGLLICNDLYKWLIRMTIRKDNVEIVKNLLGAEEKGWM